MNGPWHCKIYIVKQYGHKVPPNEANPALGLDPWNSELFPVDIQHFVDVSNKVDIPIYLARAQLAVLSLSKSIKTFAIPASQNLKLELERTQEAFSPNVIRLDIQAPNLPSLSFFDLPGVIVEDVEVYVPKTLVKKNISTSR